MSPVFAHGELRLYLIALLGEGPRHGYELIQDLEDRFNGLYTPSPGTIYPRLAKLEEDGLIERTETGRKAVYALTDAGRAELAERQAEVHDLRVGLDQSVRAAAEQVRGAVQDHARDRREELKAAARAARADARPAPARDWRHSEPPGARSYGTDGSDGPQDRVDDRDRSTDAPSDTRSDTRSDADTDRGPGSGNGWGNDWGSGWGGGWSGNWNGGWRGDRHRPGFSGRSWSGGHELESIVAELRNEVREGWKQHGLSAEQTQRIGDVVRNATEQIAEILRSDRGR